MPVEVKAASLAEDEKSSAVSMLRCLSKASFDLQLDEAKPTCQRCEKANLSCDGYRGYTFVEDRSYLSKTQPAGKAEISEVSRKGSSLRASGSSDNSEGGSKSLIRRQDGPMRLALTREPDLSSFKAATSQNFLIGHFLGHMGQDNSSLFIILSNLSTSTRNSIGALASAFFGRIHSQMDMRQYGAVMYGQALRHLAKDLSDTEQAWSLSVLYSTLNLAWYEQVEPNGGLWIKHAGGIGRLLESRGPWRHRSSVERTILEAARPMIVSQK